MKENILFLQFNTEYAEDNNLLKDNYNICWLNQLRCIFLLLLYIYLLFPHDYIYLLFHVFTSDYFIPVITTST